MAKRYIDESDIYKLFEESNGIIKLHVAQIDELPRADVVEVNHGKWIIRRDEYDNEYMMCSCCKEEFYPFDADTVDTTPNYCMNCGARMDGE